MAAAYMQEYYSHLPPSLVTRKREDFDLSEKERQEMDELEQNAFIGDLKKVEELISKNNEPHFDLYFKTFWYAAYGGHIFIMDRYIKVGSLNRIHQGDTAFHAAARKAQEVAVAYLLFRKVDVNARNEKGQTALHVLLAEKDKIPDDSRKTVAEYLLSEGAFPDLPDPENKAIPRTLLQQRWGLSIELTDEQIFFQAIEMGDLQKFSEQQRKFQSSVIHNQLGQSPFHQILSAPIAKKLKIRMIQELASGRREWIDSKDQQGQTALLCAVKIGELELTRVLLASKADPNLSDKKKKTPLHFAPTSSFVRLLVSHRASLEAKDSGDTTPLLKATRNGRVSVIRVLCELGAEIRVKDILGDTPLHMVPNLECATPFLGYKELINARNIFGQTSLHKAILREARQGGTGKLDLINALLRAGANSSASFKAKHVYMESPLTYAKDLLRDVKKEEEEEIIYTLGQIIGRLKEVQREQDCALS